MAERVVLHIGTMKSGTTFLQNVLSGNRDALEQEGVSFVGGRWRDQVQAAQDVIEHGGRKQQPLSPHGPWQRIVDEISAWSGTALFSVEFFGARKRSKIEQIVGSFRGTDLTVVLTIRDLARSIPSMWQESVQNGGRATWDEFLRAVREEKRGESELGDSFWRQQAAAEMARRWAAAVGKDNVVIVTSPPRGGSSRLLWDRYAQVVGVDPDSCNLDVPANPSLGLASTLVLRSLNEELAVDPLSRKEYHQKVKRALAKRGLARHRNEESALGLDETWVYERAAAEISALRELGCPVVGDLEELTAHRVPGVHPDSVSVEEQLTAAVRGLGHVVRQLAAKPGSGTD